MTILTSKLSRRIAIALRTVRGMSNCDACGGQRAIWLTITDIADEVGVSQSTLYKWSRRGAPDFPKHSKLPNGAIRVLSTDLAAWMELRAA